MIRTTRGNGIFPLLYRKRTGSKLAAGQQLGVKRLLSYCLDIAWELDRLGYDRQSATPVWYVLALDEAAKATWGLAAVGKAKFLASRNQATKLWLKHMTEVGPPDEWKTLFGFSTRVTRRGLRFFETAERPIIMSGPGQSDATGQQEILNQDLWTALAPILESSTFTEWDLTLNKSWYLDTFLPMSPSLARYATMFYCSSLVRYKPERLDPAYNPQLSWLLDAFVRQAPLHLLHSFVNNIGGAPVEFYTVLRS
jgi:hypothetical protein